MGLFDWLAGNTAESGSTRITAEDLMRQINSGQKPYVVDVRERDELLGPLGALPGVKNIPLSELERRFDEIPKDRPVILICRSGGRSGQAMMFLQGQGYTQIKNAAGGMLAVRDMAQK